MTLQGGVRFLWRAVENPKPPLSTPLKQGNDRGQQRYQKNDREDQRRHHNELGPGYPEFDYR
jgi:hypothetical protein